MKKIIIVAVMMAFSTISAKAVDFSAFSLTGGLAQNSGVYGASGTETNNSEDGTVGTVSNESGVFTDSYGSQFVELGFGSWVSLGYEHTPDSVSTPTNTSRHGHANEMNVSVDFNDLNTTYIKINTPWGLYLKAGSVETDLDIKEVDTDADGSTYANKSTEGTVTAIGYQKHLGESGFGWRIEGSYMELDDVTTNNGKANTQAAGGLNTIKADNIEGLTAKVALTYTFGRN